MTLSLSKCHLQVGNRVGVQRRVSGALHFYINGVDLGAGASRVPADVYGVVSLWGKTEQVTIKWYLTGITQTTRHQIHQMCEVSSK